MRGKLILWLTMIGIMCYNPVYGKSVLIVNGLGCYSKDQNRVSKTHHRIKKWDNHVDNHRVPKDFFAPGGMREYKASVNREKSKSYEERIEEGLDKWSYAYYKLQQYKEKRNEDDTVKIYVYVPGELTIVYKDDNTKDDDKDDEIK